MGGPLLIARILGRPIESTDNELSRWLEPSTRETVH